MDNGEVAKDGGKVFVGHDFAIFDVEVYQICILSNRDGTTPEYYLAALVYNLARSDEGAYWGPILLLLAPVSCHDFHKTPKTKPHLFRGGVSNICWF